MSVYKYSGGFVARGYVGALVLMAFGCGAIVWPARMNHGSIWELPTSYLIVAVGLGLAFPLWLLIAYIRFTRPIEINNEGIGQLFRRTTLRWIKWTDATLIEIEKTAPADVGMKRLRISANSTRIVIGFAIQNHAALIREVSSFAKLHGIPIRFLSRGEARGM